MIEMVLYIKNKNSLHLYTFLVIRVDFLLFAIKQVYIGIKTSESLLIICQVFSSSSTENAYSVSMELHDLFPN